MPRSTSKPRITLADAEAALKVHPELMGLLARVKDFSEKRARLERVERAQIEQGKSTARYQEAQVAEAQALEALRQCLSLIPLPEVPHP